MHSFAATSAALLTLLTAPAWAQTIPSSAGNLTATVIVPSNTGPAVRLIADALRNGTAVPEQLLLPPVSFPDVGQLARRR